MRKALSVLAILGSAALAGAQTLYDNINGYTWGAGNTTTGWGIGGTAFTGQQFTATASGTVGTLELAIQQLPNSTVPTSGKVGIFVDNPGSPDTMGTMLGTEATFSSVPAHNSGTILSVAGQSAWQLTANTKYWVRVIPDSGAAMVWRNTATPPMGYVASSSNATEWFYYANQPIAGMRINAVPEPATLASLSLGAVGLLRRRRSKGRA